MVSTGHKKDKMLRIRLDAEFLTQIRYAADSERTSVSDFTRRAIVHEISGILTATGIQGGSRYELPNKFDG